MAIISDTTKIDKSFKFISGKAYTTTEKSVDNEDAPSGFIIGASSIFSQDAGIPTTAPGVSTSILTFYGDGTAARFRMIQDVSSPTNRSWYASTDGTSLTTMRNTRVSNWVPPAFGNYTIRLFLTHGTSTTAAYVQEIFFSDQTSPLFDYKSGILTFESDPLAAYSALSPTPDGIQISAYAYIGPLLSQIFDGNGNFSSGLSDVGSGTALAKFLTPAKTFDVSSPHAIGSSWITETTPYGTSSVTWNATQQFPNGEIVFVGGLSSNASPAIAISYGNGIWRKATTIPGGLSGLRAVWAAPDGYNVYALDLSNNLIHSLDSARTWTTLSAPPISASTRIWGSSANDIYIVGATGGIAHSTNGTSFSTQTNADTHNLNGIWGSSNTDVYAVGVTGTILHSTGTGTWTVQTSGTSNSLSSVFGLSSTDVYAVGASGTILHSTGGGTWTAFNNGSIPGSFTCSMVWGYSSSGTKRIYVGGTDSGSTYKVYFSSGTNVWTLQNTFSGPATQSFNTYGGSSGIFGGLDAGRIGALHSNPVVAIHGHTILDGYLASTNALIAPELNITTTANFNASSSLPATLFTGSGTTNFTILSGSAADAGEGFRLWRESQTVYTLDLGSKVSSANDGVTPFAAGGRIRLGGFSTSPSTTARGEIETVTSSSMSIFARQGDLNLGTTFGIDTVSIGAVKITTTNGSINLTTHGTGNPATAGDISLNPSTNVFVNLPTGTTSSSLAINSSGGSHSFFGNGAYTNSGTINTNGLNANSGTITTTGTLHGGLITTSSYISSGAGVGTGGHIPVGSKVESLGDINCLSGQIFCTSGPIIANANYVQGTELKATGAVRANTAFGASLRMAAEVASTGSFHFGMHLTMSGVASYSAGWGLGYNPCPINTYFDTAVIVSARLIGFSSVVVFIDHDSLPSKRDQDPYFPGGTFGNEFLVMLEWHMNTSSPSGFTLGGRVAIA